MLGAVGTGGRRECVRKQRTGTGPGKTEAAACAGEGEQGVVARFGARGNTEVKMVRAQFTAHAIQVAPRPPVEAVFAGERGPGRVERYEFDGGCKAGEQRRGVRFGEECDPRVGGGGAEKRHRKREIAEAPEFDGEQARRRGRVWRRFCQAREVEF